MSLPMKLEINGNSVEDNLTEESLDQHVRAFAEGESGSFIILSSGAQQYVQAFKNSDGSFELERREGSEAEHWVCSDTYISVDRLRFAFKSYLQGLPSWPEQLSWVRFGEHRDGTSGARLWLVAFVVAAVLALVWFATEGRG